MTPDGEVRPPRRITPFAPPHFAVRALAFPLDDASIVALVEPALQEDEAFTDITTIATVLSTRRASASVVAREAGVLCGVPLALAAFRLLDSTVTIRVDTEDGQDVQRGAGILYVSGHARGMLAAERTALNFLQRLSGISTHTRRFVDAVRGTSAKIVDTRKTLPGWRRLEKYAVRCGGGQNHRMDLATGVLIKDNHLAALEGDVATAVRRAREHARGMSIQVECETTEQVRAAVDAGADGVLLDNMSLETLRESVAIARGHSVTEASGGVRLDNVRAIAETGVDRISVGAITHSAPVLNLALDFE